MKEEEIKLHTKVNNVSEFNLLKHSKIVWILKEFINESTQKISLSLISPKYETAK